MTEITQSSSLASLKSTFKNANRLFLFGAILVDLSLIFWLISFSDYLFLTWLDTFYAQGVLSLTTSALNSVRLTFGIATGMMFGWGFAIMALSTHFTRANRSLFLFGLNGWFLIDSLTSVLTGFYLNTVFNLVFYLVGISLAYTMELAEEEDHQ